MIMLSETKIDTVHYWVVIETDKKGIPTKYRCVWCLKEYTKPIQKNIRDYLRAKYALK